LRPHFLARFSAALSALQAFIPLWVLQALSCPLVSFFFALDCCGCEYFSEMPERVVTTGYLGSIVFTAILAGLAHELHSE
jgi:hypothetical protein